MTTFEIALDLSAQRLAKNTKIGNDAWLLAQPYWLKASEVVMKASEKPPKAAAFRTSGKDKFTAGKAHIVMALLAMEIARQKSLQSEGGCLVAPEPVLAPSMFNAVQALNGSGHANSTNSLGIVASMFPPSWKVGDSFFAAEQPGSRESSSLCLLVKAATIKHGKYLVPRELPPNEIEAFVTVTLDGVPCNLATMEKIFVKFTEAQNSKGAVATEEPEDEPTEDATQNSADCDGIVGREWIYEKIRRTFEAGRRRGAPLKPGGDYLCLIAPPGVGKTTICRGFSNRFNLPVVFIRRGQTSAASFLTQFHTQIMGRVPTLSYKMPSEAAESGPEYLSKLLEAANTKLEATDGYLEIVIDALDEAPVEVLELLPRSLPKRISVFATFRGSKIESCPLLGKVDNLESFVLQPDSDENIADVDQYLAQAAQLPQLVEYANGKGVPVAEVIAALRDRSEFNFMYLYYVLRDLAEKAQFYESLDRLPQGLEGYYKLHLGLIRNKSGPGNEWNEVRLPILTVLASCARPQSVEWIQLFASPKKDSPIRQILILRFLEEIEQFLIDRQEKIKSGRIVTTYRIYHADFRDFLNWRAELCDDLGIQEKIRKHIAACQMKRHKKGPADEII